MISKELQDQIKKTKKELENYTQNYQVSDTTFNAIQSAMNVDKSILELAKNQQEEAKKYANLYSKTVEDIVASQSSLKSTKSLLSLAESIDKEQFKIDMGELSYREHISHPLPEIRNYTQEMLDVLEVQKETLHKIVVHSDKQNNFLKQQVILTEESSKEQGKNNRIAIYITLFVAVISIAVSVYSMNLSIKKSEEIYQKENNSSTLQNSIVNSKLENIKQNTNNKKLIKNIKNQTIILNHILEELKGKDKNDTK